MKKTLLILISVIGLISCEKEELISPSDNYTLTVDGRLDTTSNGLYKLQLNSTSNSIQTIHRLTGKLLNNGIEPYPPQLVNWESSHSWTLTDTAYVMIRRIINTNGQWVNVDTTYVTGFGGAIIPTINSSSYSGTDGEINTVIAPVDNMIGDTMVVKCKFKNLEKTIRIILE
tara:strand:+ start:3034 stop:3549 length:516 start_codon:yes stop_codon:yes gene_type:complete